MATVNPTKCRNCGDGIATHMANVEDPAACGNWHPDTLPWDSRVHNGEGVWWRRGVGGPGHHPGCTCPMTGDPAAWHHDDCAAHDNDAREIERTP